MLVLFLIAFFLIFFISLPLFIASRRSKDLENKKILKAASIGLIVVAGIVVLIGKPNKEEALKYEAKKAQQEEKRANFLACQKQNKYSDKERTTAALVTEVEFQRMGKSYLLEGKSIGEKVDIFCEAKSGYSQH